MHLYVCLSSDRTINICVECGDEDVLWDEMSRRGEPGEIRFDGRARWLVATHQARTQSRAKTSKCSDLQKGPTLLNASRPCSFTSTSLKNDTEVTK